MIADVTPPEQRGHAFGFHRALDHSGAIVGPLIATLLLGYGGMSLRGVFYVAIVPAAIGVVMLLLILKEKKREIAPRPEKKEERIADEPLPPEFKTAMSSIGLFALANSSDVFLLLQARHAGASVASLPLLWSAHHVLKAILSERAGAFSDRIDRRWLLVTGWMTYAAIYFIFPFAHSIPALLTLFVLYAVPFGLTEGAERAWIAEPVTPAARGRAFGIFYLVSGVATLLGTLAFGAIYDNVSPAMAFFFGGSLAVLASLSVLLQRRKVSDW
jgi:MFS family permease